MKAIGIAIVLICVSAPLIWFVPLMANHDPIAVFSQYIGCVALIAMGLSQLMAARFRWLETLFGGLDRIYVLHKWIGIAAMVAVLLHDTVDAEIDGLGRETLLVELAETLGELSLYGLLILVVITVTTFIPYRLWRWTHKLMGAFFAFSAFHYMFILKPFSNWDPVGLYVNAFCIIGIVCYIYTLLPFAMFQGRFPYRIQKLEKTGDAIAVSLEPEKRGIQHKAGQFAFIQFDLDGWSEVHPFTISKGPEDARDLRFTIKPLGDDTHSLSSKLAEGVRARVSPAYGHFMRKSNKDPEIWIAGGIGVTPFAAFASTIKDSSSPIHFFYCVSDQTNASHLAEFKALAKRNENFKLHLIETRRSGRLNLARIEEMIDFPIKDATVFYCGPEALRKSLKADMITKGLSSRAFKYEEFEIRSGIGISTILNYVLGRLFSEVKKRTAVHQS